MQSIKDTLWSYGISGDNAIVTIIIKDYEDINIIYNAPVAEVGGSYPGVPLSVGDVFEEVRIIQNLLPK